MGGVKGDRNICARTLSQAASPAILKYPVPVADLQFAQEKEILGLSRLLELLEPKKVSLGTPGKILFTQAITALSAVLNRICQLPISRGYP